MAVTCPACQAKYADHFERCIQCAAPRPGAAAPAAPVPAPLPARASAPPPATPSKSECPMCTGAPGKGTIRMEKREYKGTNWTGSRRKYLVRWVDIPGVCGRCSKNLEIRRFIADVLVNVPFVVFFLLLVAMDSKAYLWPLLIYALVVFKWSWGLGYLWADLLLYGTRLDTSLARFEPPGDAGTTRFPAGIGHCLLRVGLLPGLCVLMGVVVGVFVPRHDGAAPPQAGTASAASELSRSDQRVRENLLAAQNLAVAVHAQTRTMVPETIERDGASRFKVYVDPTKVPSGWSYQRMTGPQLLTAFLRTSGPRNDLLILEDAAGFSITRADAAVIAKTIAAAEPPASEPLQR